jgi:hypothetical protein
MEWLEVTWKLKEEKFCLFLLVDIPLLLYQEAIRDLLILKDNILVIVLYLCMSSFAVLIS